MASTHGYVTAAVIKRLLPRITQSSNFDTDDEIEAYISEAEELVNSKLAMRYTVPLTGTIPAIVTYITSRIAAYNILLSEYTGDSENVNEWTDKWWDAPMRMLGDIIERKMKLVDGDGDELAEETTIKTSRGDYMPFYDLDGEFDQQLDNDLEDAIENERD